MSEKVCPSCGHCKECGRGGHSPYWYPYQTYPNGWYPYSGPWYYQTGAAGNIGNATSGYVQTVTTGTTPVSGNIASLWSNDSK